MSCWRILNKHCRARPCKWPRPYDPNFGLSMSPKLLRSIYRFGVMLRWLNSPGPRDYEVKYMNEPCNACSVVNPIRVYGYWKWLLEWRGMLISACQIEVQFLQVLVTWANSGSHIWHPSPLWQSFILSIEQDLVKFRKEGGYLYVWLFNPSPYEQNFSPFCMRVQQNFTLKISLWVEQLW